MLFCCLLFCLGLLLVSSGFGSWRMNVCGCGCCVSMCSVVSVGCCWFFCMVWVSVVLIWKRLSCMVCLSWW